MILVILQLVGCIEFGLDPIDPEGEPKRLVAVTETFVQQALPEVDVLFVIDNTASMSQEQASLAADFDTLVDELDLAGVAWQLGVVSTDMSGPEGGWLRGNPWVLTPGTPDRALQFAELVQVGTDGLAAEAGLAAATTALSLAVAEGPNEGFRRPDAAVHVVFVSDADDDSDGADPVGAFLEQLALESSTTDRPSRASAIVGDMPSGCTGADGTAQAGSRYAEVVAATGGSQISICTSDLAPIYSSLAELSIVYSTRFDLREVPEPDSALVEVDGEVLSDGWDLQLDPPAIRFDEAPVPEASIRVTYLVSNT